MVKARALNANVRWASRQGMKRASGRLKARCWQGSRARQAGKAKPDDKTKGKNEGRQCKKAGNDGAGKANKGVLGGQGQRMGHKAVARTGGKARQGKPDNDGYDARLARAGRDEGEGKRSTMRPGARADEGQGRR